VPLNLRTYRPIKMPITNLFICVALPCSNATNSEQRSHPTEESWRCMFNPFAQTCTQVSFSALPRSDCLLIERSSSAQSRERQVPVHWQCHPPCGLQHIIIYGPCGAFRCALAIVISPPRRQYAEAHQSIQQSIKFYARSIDANNTTVMTTSR